MRRNFSWHDSEVVARLKPGLPLEQARESMAALSLQLTAKDFRGSHSVIVTPVRGELAGKTQTALVLLLCAAAALLLIACVNLANLLMSRGAVRGREVAVRVALGAGRGRLVAQFLTESLVLAGLGAVAGLALAVPAMRVLETLVPETMGTVRLTLDWRVLAFSGGAAIAAVLTFGLAPALRGSRRAPQDALRQCGRGPAGARSHWFQHSLIVIETALAAVLLTCGALLLHTFQHLRNTDLGIRRERLLTFETPLFRYAFALLALFLASFGLYGVLSYTVTQRTNEIGVRMALGATSHDILLSFGRRGMALTVAGLASGLVLAAIAARLMTTLFYGFRPDYLPAVAVVSLVLLAVAALASLVPARRASRIDPMVALQHE
jgi:ABC-type antimicrobial peptide transport system permease subunit